MSVRICCGLRCDSGRDWGPRPGSASAKPTPGACSGGWWLDEPPRLGACVSVSHMPGCLSSVGVKDLNIQTRALSSQGAGGTLKRRWPRGRQAVLSRASAIEQVGVCAVARAHSLHHRLRASRPIAGRGGGTAVGALPSFTALPSGCVPSRSPAGEHSKGGAKARSL